AATGQALGPRQPPADGARVRLLEPGAESRRTLRYRFAAQEKRSLELALDSSLKLSAGSIDLPEVQVPTLKLVVGLAPGPAQADGSMRFALRLEKAEALALDGLPPHMLEAMRSELAGFVGLTGSCLVDAWGLTLEADAALPPTAAPKHLEDQAEELRQLLRQLAVPLPEEPVGVGARWEVRRTLAWEWLRIGAEIHAYRGEQTAVYRLTALDGDRLELALELSRTFPAQALMADNPMGSPGTLDALESKGSGLAVVDLRSPVPEASLGLETHKRMTGYPRGRDGPGRVSSTDSTLKLTLKVLH
ncbi:MAG TPA: hypothetical protein P5076_10400, partial [Myxococcota bacterium]|nr:hypothetical protein [Myxococcota bacterium]